MDFRVVAATKIRVVFLLAVIRQGLTGKLPAGNPAAISECCYKQKYQPLQVFARCPETGSTLYSTNETAPTWNADHLLARNQRGIGPPGLPRRAAAGRERALMMFLMSVFLRRSP